MPRIDEHGRPEPEPAAGELDTLVGFLEFQRATLEWKCAGLGEEGLRTTTAASTMTLAGLLKHMSFVEDHWFSKWLRGNEPCPPWDTVDFSVDPDWEWDTARHDSPDHLREMWAGTVERSRVMLDEALADGGLDQLARRTWPTGEAPSLRWILVHMIEEYARHNGHADLLREVVDGRTGE